MREQRIHVLYLGLRCPKNTKSHYYTHYPVIQIQKSSIEAIREFCNQITQATHLILTSKTSVSILNELQCHLSLKTHIIAVGKSTASAIQQIYANPIHIAQTETAEGVVQILEQLLANVDNPIVFWPKSAQARPIISNFLKTKNISLHSCDFYNVLPYNPQKSIQLSQFDQIFFTSPSTVRSFFAIHHHIPEHIELLGIGPITSQALEQRLAHTD